MRLLNFLLSALSAEDLAALSPALTEVVLAPGEVLFEPGVRPSAVFFPGGACVSLLTLMSDGRAVENATVGRESAAGLMEAITEQPATSRAVSQIPGGAMRMPAARFRAQMERSPALRSLSLRHLRANAAQAEQGVACNATHDVSARLSRWLLMTHDRAGSKTFSLTQEYMAVMTGVQRSTVSLAASALKAEGVIDYSRGQMVILDRHSLERRACECYGIIGAHFEALRASAAAAP